MILEFNVSNNILKKKDASIKVEQSSDYCKCRFYLRKMWKDSVLFATFTNDLGYIETVRLGEYAKVLSCIVPPRISSGGFFSFYIYSNDRKTNTISITLTNIQQKKEKKCNVISEIFSQIAVKIDEIIYDNYQIKCYSNGILVDAIYIGNVDEEIVKDWISEQMITFKETLADVAFTGSYRDLTDVPETFKPSAHLHGTTDITDINELNDEEKGNLLSLLTNEINLI